MQRYCLIALFILAIAKLSTLAQCNDFLYKHLLKPIKQMTDGEYRSFRELLGDCENYNSCIDTQLVWLKDKPIAEMTLNESDYFIDKRLYCYSINPCSLKQYILIKDKKQFDMTNREFAFFNECRDKCRNYRPGSRKSKKWIIIFISIGSGVALAAAAGVIWYFPYSDGPK